MLHQVTLRHYLVLRLFTPHSKQSELVWMKPSERQKQSAFSFGLIYLTIIFRSVEHTSFLMDLLMNKEASSKFWGCRSFTATIRSPWLNKHPRWQGPVHCETLGYLEERQQRNCVEYWITVNRMGKSEQNCIYHTALWKWHGLNDCSLLIWF